MDGLELVAFTIISHVGSAKSHIMESMVLSREGKLDDARKKIEEANSLLREGEKEHFKVITQEAKERNIELTLLFMHAEDQLMTTVCLRDVAMELIETNQNVENLKNSMEELKRAVQ